MLGEGVRRKRQGRGERPARPERLQRRAVVEQPRRHDRRHAPAGRKTVHRGLQVPRQLLERRIENDGVEAPGRREKVSQVDGVVSRSRCGREEAVQQGGAVKRQLIQRQLRPAGFRDGSDQPGAGGRLEHPVAGPDLSRSNRDRRQRRRRGELR